MDCTPTARYGQTAKIVQNPLVGLIHKHTHTHMTLTIAYLYVQNKDSRPIKSDKCNKHTAKPIIYSGIKLKKK